ncbi:MAG: DEAD/DEAH box helicase family protein [Verrucomicrobia bacterium]|jgi:type I site-specific restriction endonuclease|nr:DEAD/DEAH box helicase family protein [Verrucomicrobiota bacterium]
MDGQTPEAEARIEIDRQLEAAGWSVQNLKDLNLYASTGVAVREVQSEGGPADYMLFVEGKALGIVEAKKVGVNLSAVAEQSARYGKARDFIPQRWADPLPFLYESTGIETYFRDQRDPDSRSRLIFAFHTPEHLLELVQQPDTLRSRLRGLPELNTMSLRDCQIDAITKLEKSLSDNRPRSLLQMATGSGKTYTAVTQAYRLIKHAGAQRILFLVDRGNLGRQTVNEFQQYTAPDDGRKFTDLYNVQMLGPAGIDPVCKVTVSTIQRLYAQLTNRELDEEADEHSGYEGAGSTVGKEPLPVTYNPRIPIESFDFVIVDECHRSIYNLWRQVLDYFDAFLIGLITNWQKFLEDNQEEITALQILYNRPHAKRHLVYEELKALADAVGKPPYHIAPAEVWKAYEHLEKRPLTADPVKTLTNLISLVRHSVDPEHVPLAPFPELVEARFDQWLDEHGTRFSQPQVHWLRVIKDYIALNGAFATDEPEDYLEAWQSVDSGEGVPLAVAKRVFGEDPKAVIEELNTALIA